MLRVVILLVLVGCATQTQTSTDPIVVGNTCLVHVDSASCAAATGCTWGAPKFACPGSAGTYCPTGECDGNPVGSVTTTQCTCEGGRVCMEQIGGPAQQAGAGPEVQCVTVGVTEVFSCSLIQGQGTCALDVVVSGLCVCDNGIR